MVEVPATVTLTRNQRALILAILQGAWKGGFCTSEEIAQELTLIKGLVSFTADEKKAMLQSMPTAGPGA